MTALADVKVSLVDSVSEAQRFLSWLGERRPVLAVDTETTGLEWWTRGFLRLVQFGDGQQGWSIPVDEWRGVVRQALDLIHEDARPTVFQNIKFDLHALASDGLTLPALSEAHDTKVMHSLHDPLSAHGLKFLAKKHFGPEAVVGETMLKADFANHGWSWATVPTNHPTYWAYGALDTVLTARLFDIYRPLTAGEAYDREMAVQAVLYRAEAKGMRVDTTYTTELRDTWMSEAEGLLHTLKEAGISNPRSNAQVSAALCEAGWEPEEFTETGLPQLDKDVLSALEERFPGVATPLLRYRRLIKWTSTYLDTFLRARDDDDRVHAWINTLAARTGRMSITSPALQTLPRGPEIRNCIIPSDSHRLWTVDYDSMEMVMLAEFCRDQNLMDAVSEEDIHRYCASLSYGVPVDAVTPAQRQIAKNCVTPDTPVLCADLVWRTAGSLRVGDDLYGFDDNLNGSPGDHSRVRMRRWRKNHVTTTGRRIEPTITITMSDGSTLTGTHDHRILVTDHSYRIKSKWCRLDAIRVGTYALRAAHVWDVATDYNSGWVAGMLDGEGHVTASGLGVAQNPGPTFDRLVRLLGPGWVDTGRRARCRVLAFRAKQHERMRELGRYGTTRLAANMYEKMDGVGFHTRPVRVVSVVDSGQREIVTLGTHTETYIANGYANHNTNFARVYGAGPKKIAATAGVEEREIRNYMDSFDARFPGVSRFIKSVEHTGKVRDASEGQPWVRTVGGRRIPAESDKIYALVNYLIQGSCADMMKDAILRLDAVGLGDNILVPVHDEIVAEFHEDDTEGPALLRECMEDRTSFAVPFTCGLDGPLQSWGSKYA